MRIGGRSVAILVLLCVTACDRKEDPKPLAPPPPTVPLPVSDPKPPAQPSDLAPAVIVINDQPYQFPAAKLVLQQSDGATRATLFSKDPPKPVEGKDTRNSFYFDMVATGVTLDELRDRGFTFDNSTGEAEESTTGIFIAGDKWRLQPLQVAVAFDTIDNQTVAMVQGTFQLFAEPKADQPPRIVNVRARLLPEVTEKK
jgi:hypothetical protein